jgi:hypothetical protein
VNFLANFAASSWRPLRLKAFLFSTAELPKQSRKELQTEAPLTQKKCGPASHRTASFRRPLKAAFPPLRAAGRLYPVRQPSHLRLANATATFTVTCCRVNGSVNHHLQPCGGQRPNLLKEQAVEEAAMPGQPARAHARLQLPPATHPRELPVCRQLRRKSSFGEPWEIQRFQ